MGGKINRELTLVEGREPNQNMARELLRTAEKMGWRTRHLKTIPSDKIAKNELSDLFSDFVIWRGPVGFKNQYEIERTVYYLNTTGKVTINTRPAGGRLCTSDKYFQHGCFAADEVVREHMLPMYSAMSRENVEALINDGFLKYPFVLKPDFGTRGEGIVLVREKNDLDNFQGNFEQFSVEPYVKSKYDWRVFVLGGSALGAMRKVGDEENEGDFMAKSGGKKRWKEENREICEEIYDLAVRVTVASGLEYAGVDFIRDDDTGRFIVLETNIAGGWQNGFLEATGIHIPTKLMQWLEDRADLLDGKPVPEVVSKYVETRKGFLSRDGKKKYEEILAFSKKISREREICNFDIEARDMPLIRKLSSAYVLVQNEDLSEVERMRIRMLMAEVEKYEISRYGNFIGKDSGSLEQSLEMTAYYLAISSKL